MLDSIRSRLLVLAGLAALTFAIGFWQTRLPAADDASCSVYRAVFANFEDKEKLFFDPISDLRPPEMRSATGPRYFQRDTGNFEERTFGAETFQVAVREEFQVDTRGYVEPILSGLPSRISNCFPNEGQPEFYSGDFPTLLDRKGRPQLDGDGAVTTVSHIRVSSVGFSSDNTNALIYIETHCGFLCGAGYFMLFEYVEGEWIESGDSSLWVS